MFSKTCEYAIRATIYIASESSAGKRCGIRDIARKIESPEPFTAKILQRLVKQRRDSAAIYIDQKRPDLAEPELAQAAVIEKFLPEQMSEMEIEEVVSRIIQEQEASGMAAMGNIMGLASAELAGKADGKTISTIVKKLLS